VRRASLLVSMGLALAVFSAGSVGRAARGQEWITIRAAEFVPASEQGRPVGVSMHAAFTLPQRTEGFRLRLLPSRHVINPAVGGRYVGDQDWTYPLSRFGPPLLLPGEYRFRFSALVGGAPVEAETRARLVAGPEGILGSVWISRTRNGPSVRSRCLGDPSRCSLEFSYALRGRNPVLWVQFRFAVAPRTGPVVVSWYGPGGRLLGTKRKAPGSRVDTFIAIRRGRALPVGAYRCVLTVGRIRLRELVIQVRR
jgi:hypothetical protein